MSRKNYKARKLTEVQTKEEEEKHEQKVNKKKIPLKRK